MGALPTLVAIGAMKCGTTALHRYLDSHPDIGMTRRTETNFFSVERHRGLGWYRSLFDPAKPTRGESSPGYTSPDHRSVAQRISEVVPDVRLIYLVRDPVDRAVSQYHHHRRDGAEPRSLSEALTNPDSHYVARSRYYDRLRPYLDWFAAGQILIVVQERLLADRRRQLAAIYRHVGVRSDWWSVDLARRWNVGGGVDDLPTSVRASYLDQVADDTERLRTFLGDALTEWRTTI